MQRIPPLSAFEKDPLRGLLEERLRKVEVGDMISYEAMSEVIGQDVRDNWGMTRRARESLLKDGIVFDVVPNTGLKRLNDEAKVAFAAGYLDKGKNAARRSIRMVRATDQAQLSPAARVRVAVVEVRAGVALQFATRRVLGRLATALTAGTEPKRLKKAVADSLAQFGGNGVG